LKCSDVLEEKAVSILSGCDRAARFLLLSGEDEMLHLLSEALVVGLILLELHFREKQLALRCISLLCVSARLAFQVRDKRLQTINLMHKVWLQNGVYLSGSGLQEFLLLNQLWSLLVQIIHNSFQGTL